MKGRVFINAQCSVNGLFIIFHCNVHTCLLHIYKKIPLKGREPSYPWPHRFHNTRLANVSLSSVGLNNHQLSSNTQSWCTELICLDLNPVLSSTGQLSRSTKSRSCGTAIRVFNLVWQIPTPSEWQPTITSPVSLSGCVWHLFTQNHFLHPSVNANRISNSWDFYPIIHAHYSINKNILNLTRNL